jgi:hypothetical protein
MPSTYTLNNGIELIGTGEQSGTWGDTTNTNLELLDSALDGQVTVTLASAGSSGSPNALPISDGAASNGRNRMVVFDDGADLGATAYVQLTPNDAEKIIYIRNDLSGSRSIILFQGTYNASNDYEVPAGTTAVVYFDGAGSGAVAANVFNNAYFDSLRLGGVSVTAILDEDNMASDSATSLATQQSIKAYVDAQVGANNELSEVLANGNTTGGNDILFDDNDKAIFGAGSDLQIYHSGSNSHITESGTGNLIIRADDFRVQSNAGEEYIAADANGAVSLRYDNDEKLATTSTGVDVTGTAVVDGLTATTADIDGGTIDDTVIGATTAAAGSFTTVGATGNITSEGQVITDTINEQTATSGVTVDGVLLKDGGATFTGNATFGDDDKAIFGAGSDLQIYHDGSASYVMDTGTGNLQLRGDNSVALRSYSTTDNYLVGNFNSSVDIYYDNAIKLATTSTGVNVTGTLTSDGLTVDGDSVTANAQNAMTLEFTSATGVISADRTGGNYANLHLKTTDGSAPKLRQAIEHNGDIKFYEDTGTTPKFFWDASAESLCIGATSTVGVGESLYLAGGGAVITGDLSSYNVNALMFGYDGSNAKIAVGGTSGASRGITFSTVSGGVEGERMLIDASGNVTINNGYLDVTGTVTADGLNIFNNIPSLTAAATFYVNRNGGTPSSAAGLQIYNNTSGGFVDSALVFGNTTNSYLEIGHHNGTSYAKRFRINSGGDATFYQGAVFNEDGLDSDFRVESDSYSHMLFVDAGNNNVGIQLNAPQSAFHINENGGPQSSGDMTTGLIVSNGTAGTAIQMGTNDASGFGYIKSGYVNSSETGRALLLYTGTAKAVSVESGETVINDDSLDRDFRVESDTNPHALYVDAGNGNVGINTSATGSTLAELTVGKAGDFPVLKISRTDASYTSGVLALGDGNGAAVNVAVWRGNQNDYSAGGNYLNLHGYQGVSIASANAEAGSGTMGVFVSPSATVINEDSADYDFRVESDTNTHALFVDAGLDRIGMGVSNPSHSLTVSGNVGSRFSNSISTLLGTGYYGAFIHAAPNAPFGTVSWTPHIEGTLAVAGQGYVSHTQLGTKRNGSGSWNTGAYIGYGGNDAGPTREWIFDTNGGFTASGTKSFKIKHPLPELNETHALLHVAIEGPNADVLYRGVATLSNGLATVNIDSESRMTEGTFVALTKDVQAFTSNETDWTPVRGSVSGNTLTIEAQDNTSTATVSWMVVAKRNDTDIIDLGATDENGEFITERLENA